MNSVDARRSELWALFPDEQTFIPTLTLPIDVRHTDKEYVERVRSGPSRLAGIVMGYAVRRAQDPASIAAKIKEGDVSIRVSWVPTTIPDLFEDPDMPPQDGLAAVTARLRVVKNRLSVASSYAGAATSGIDFYDRGDGLWRPLRAHIVSDCSDDVVLPVDGYVRVTKGDLHDGHGLAFSAAAYKLGETASWAATIMICRPDSMGVTIETLGSGL